MKNKINKILFINTPRLTLEQLNEHSERSKYFWEVYPPLGLMYLSASLKEEKKEKVYLKSENYESKIFTSPKLRRYARELGADLHKISGSERKGRITEDDIKKFIKQNM